MTLEEEEEKAEEEDERKKQTVKEEKQEWLSDRAFLDAAQELLDIGFAMADAIQRDRRCTENAGHAYSNDSADIHSIF
jgi:hypothetical protein